MSLPETMRAAVLEEFGKPLVIKDVPVPKPGRGEILVKLEASGVCHSDLHIQDGDWLMQAAIPITLGHEGVGRVVALGPEVSELKEGDRVCVPWVHSACGRCEHCCAGWETVCDQMPIKATGFTENGCFAEYVKAKADYAGRIADNLKSAQVAPLACAGLTVYKGLKMTDVKPGQWVVVVGAAGGLGHVAVQYAKAMGMKVVGIDCGEEKLEFIRSLGAELAVEARAADFKEQIIAKTGGGSHGAIILVPVKTTVQDAVEYCRKRATIVQIAMPPGELSANIFMMVAKALTIRASCVGTRNDLKEALQFAADGKVNCNVSVRKFSEVNELLDELRGGKVTGRLVMDMTQ